MGRNYDALYYLEHPVVRRRRDHPVTGGHACAYHPRPVCPPCGQGFQPPVPAKVRCNISFSFVVDAAYATFQSVGKRGHVPVFGRRTDLFSESDPEYRVVRYFKGQPVALKCKIAGSGLETLDATVYARTGKRSMSFDRREEEVASVTLEQRKSPATAHGLNR
jgi:hypothetical protein